jgi:hypothetical protein
MAITTSSSIRVNAARLPALKDPEGVVDVVEVCREGELSNAIGNLVSGKSVKRGWLGSECPEAG